MQIVGVIVSQSSSLSRRLVHSTSRFHRGGMLAFKQATSMSVLARVTVTFLAGLYQIVPSIIFRVTVIAHAIR